MSGGFVRDKPMIYAKHARVGELYSIAIDMLSDNMSPNDVIMRVADDGFGKLRFLTCKGIIPSCLLVTLYEL